ncbi:RepB family protein [Sulfolobus tengchongensis]|uniref:RepB family protein n=1 Tax=Sulfolobus tengchongensis TaxID=207809 RepID=A0AAX4L173_9CREN
MKKKLQTVVDEKIYNSIVEYCERYGISQGEFVREAIIEKLQKMQEIKTVA